MNEMNWIVTRVDGKIASVHTDYSGLQRIATWLAKNPKSGVKSVTTQIMGMAELKALNETLSVDDIVLFGTEFQKMVWTRLFMLNHSDMHREITSYGDFATFCGNRPGVRAVAHAVGLNPIAYIIPCHWIVPKACIRNIEEAYNTAIGTIFNGTDLYFFNAFDFGEYALGTQLKRDLLAVDFAVTE